MQADGGKACKQMIEAIQEGKTEANFFEGMGCVGGCVGGPRALLPREEGSATWIITEKRHCIRHLWRTLM